MHFTLNQALCEYVARDQSMLCLILRDMNKTKCSNGLYSEFRQTFAKETFSSGENLKS